MGKRGPRIKNFEVNIAKVILLCATTPEYFENLQSLFLYWKSRTV